VTPEEEDQEIEQMRQAAAEWRSFRERRVEREYRKLVDSCGFTPAIDMSEPFTTDDYGVLTLGRWGGWLVQICPMLFNDRIVLTPEHFQAVVDHGWCFDKGGAAFLAALIWDPSTQAEPSGYKKRATHRAREVGETCRRETMPIGAEAVAAMGLAELLSEDAA
jgi:hypothetical protein